MNLFKAIFTDASAPLIALNYEGRQITYADLREQTLRFAAALDSLKTEPGERVALLLNDSPEFITSFTSTCVSGAIAVPINMGLRAEEQRAIIADSAVSVALVEADICNSLLTGGWEQLRSLREVVVIHRNDGKTPVKMEFKKQGVNTRSLDELLSKVSPKKPNFSESAANQAAFILYTSGSTGEPKGAVHTQADIFYTNRTFCREVLRLRGGDRIFSSSRLPFAYGLGNSMTFPLLNGVTSVLCRTKPTPEVISKIFAEAKPTIFFGVPVAYNLLLEHHRRHGVLDCSSLRLCVSAGEALPAQLGEDWQKTFGLEVLDGIGSTEMLHMFMSNNEGEVRYGSSGKVLNGYEARLLDQEGNPTRDGDVGNLWVRGASAAKGYWRKPDITERTFVDGWVRTGDLYSCDADGYWFHMGRSDDCFKSSGQWVSPVEVEGALLRNARVSRVAVVEDFDEDGLPCAGAFVVCADPAEELTNLENELREFLRGQLPRFKQPRRYFFVEELPYTATGKIQRFRLREQLRKSAGQTAHR